MSDTERLRAVAQTEITNHHNEADRLKSVAHELLNNADWHLGQARNWIAYAEQLVTGAVAEVIPLQRPELTLIIGEQV